MSAELTQRTVAGPVTIEGFGLFTGSSVSATIRPAEEDSGVLFVRSDLPGRPVVQATVSHVADAPRRTVLTSGEARVETVEHCLGALAGLGIDNAVVEVRGPELPAGDGSAAMFVEALSRAGTLEQGAIRHPIVVREPITVRDGEATLAIVPSASSSLEIVYMLDYGEHSPIARQTHAFSVTPESFATEIAPARTFSTAAEARAARELGMFAHLTPRDMLVIDASGPIDNTLRFANEPARHKLLDLLGDISLVGRPILGRLVAYRSGHTLNHRLAREITARFGVDARGDQSKPAMPIGAILRVLPHRYPMILIDRVLELDGDRRAVGVKNVTINEPFFQGHYPETPIMPGVLIVEAMCQLAGLMLANTLDRTNRVAVLVSLDRVRLRKAVTPGDRLILEVEAVKSTPRYGDVECRGLVDGALVAEARVKFMMVVPEASL
jgi:UDP-3-O-[3-hydroxymyristoyl] N-acetylglucosamine deacetylase/3-hydroxyacyl-[acyl-carrier-protein] dehydratase